MWCLTLVEWIVPIYCKQFTIDLISNVSHDSFIILSVFHDKLSPPFDSKANTAYATKAHWKPEGFYFFWVTMWFIVQHRSQLATSLQAKLFSWVRHKATQCRCAQFFIFYCIKALPFPHFCNIQAYNVYLALNLHLTLQEEMFFFFLPFFKFIMICTGCTIPTGNDFRNSG